MSSHRVSYAVTTGLVERVRAAVLALLAGPAERRRWRLALGRRPELAAFAALLTSPPSTIPTSLELALLARIDERSLRRRVGAATGLTPVEAVKAAKLLRAGQRLRATDLPIATIASAEGFASVAAFDHAFIRYVGSTPTDFRRGPEVADRGAR